MPIYFFQEHKEDVPELLIDEEKGYISIIGSSYPEDVTETYENFLSGLNSLKVLKGKDFICELKLEILSSASMRILHELFIQLDEFNDAGSKVSVNWFFERDDDDMEEVGLSFTELFDFEFNVIGKK